MKVGWKLVCSHLQWAPTFISLNAQRALNLYCISLLATLNIQITCMCNYWWLSLLYPNDRIYAHVLYLCLICTHTGLCCKKCYHLWALVIVFKQNTCKWICTHNRICTNGDNVRKMLTLASQIMPFFNKVPTSLAVGEPEMLILH